MVESKHISSTPIFDLLVVILSVYVLAALLVDTFFTLDPETSRLIYILDDLICIVFLVDVVIRYRRAPSKSDFMKWGWIDLISSIPTFEFLRVGRVARLLRLVRVLRAFRSVKYISNYVFKNKAQGTFATVTTIAFLMIIFGSVAILQVEQDFESNIRTAEDAIWWSFVTITTVGYGDMYPVTVEGRIIAGFMMITGVGLFGTFTGYIAAWFMDAHRPK